MAVLVYQRVHAFTALHSPNFLGKMFTHLGHSGGLQESDEMLGLCILLAASASHSEHPLSRGCEEGAAMLARCESPAVLLQKLGQRKQCLLVLLRCCVILVHFDCTMMQNLNLLFANISYIVGFLG